MEPQFGSIVSYRNTEKNQVSQLWTQFHSDWAVISQESSYQKPSGACWNTHTIRTGLKLL